MTFAFFVCVLAQAPLSRPAGSVGPALLIALLSAAVGVAVLATIALRRRRDRIELQDLSERYRFQAVTDPNERGRIRGYVDALFGEGPKIGRMLKQRSGGLDFHLVTMRVPLYRVDEGGAWDERMQESQEKLVLFVSDFGAPLPPFRLMPNSWALTTVRGKEANVFHNIEPFGYRNYVLADAKEWTIHVLTGEPMHLLRGNRQLTIDARPDFLAFYLQDERPQPPNLPEFLEKSLRLATAIRDRALAHARGHRLVSAG